VQALDIKPRTQLLFEARNSDSEWSAEPFTPGFVALDGDAARHLRGVGVGCVGVDYLPVGKADVHHAPPDAGFRAIEELALQRIAPGQYGADRSP
jgi:arylformamidase